MKCKYDNDRIISFLDRQLDDSEKEELNNHLKSCERCAKKFKVFEYSEKFFRQEVEVEQTLADKVMLNIDENKYKRDTKVTRAAIVFYRYKPVWKTALSLTVAAFLTFLVFRYSSSIIEIKDNIVAAIKHMDNDYGIQKNSKEDIVVPSETPTQLSTKESDHFIPDITGIKEIMTLNKKQMFKRLGENYTIVNAGAEHSEVGYRYENYGMTIIFGDSNISLIECDEKVSINGAKLGMTFTEIKNILGEGETRKLTPIEPEQPNYALFYTYSDIRIWFGSMEEDGASTHLQIRRYLDNTISEESVPSDFYDICIKKAKNQTQIDELNKLKNDTTHGSIGYYKRAALTIIGDLPNNQKRLSLAQAEKLVDSKDNPTDIVNAFNKIAGAPDFEGGSGMTWAIYFLDEKKSEAIYVSGNMLFSYVKYDEDGKRKQSRRLGEDTLPIPAFSSNPHSSYDK